MVTDFHRADFIAAVVSGALAQKEEATLECLKPFYTANFPLLSPVDTGTSDHKKSVKNSS